MTHKIEIESGIEIRKSIAFSTKEKKSLTVIIKIDGDGIESVHFEVKGRSVEGVQIYEKLSNAVNCYNIIT